MIEIKVSGASITEVADKLLAIGANLRGSAIVEGARAAVNAMKVLGVEPSEPVVHAPGVVVVPAPEPSAGPAAPEPAAETGADAPSAAPATASPSEPVISADALKDLVLAVVRAKGRDAMVAVLDTFGAARASDVPQEQVPELVAALEAMI